MKMEDEFKKHQIAKLKRGALFIELVPALVIGITIYHFLDSGILDTSGISCSFPHFEPYTSDFHIDSWADFSAQRCTINFLVKIGSSLLLLYLLLSALMISSPLKSTPLMYFSGLYLTNEKGQQPELHQALKLMLFSMNLIPAYMVILFYVYNDFKVTLHQDVSLLFTFAFLTVSFQVFEVLRKSDLVWDERVSGLRFHVTEKKLKKLDKEAEKINKSFYQTYYKIFLVYKKKNIGLFLIFVLWSFLTFNALREGSASENYNEALYKRDAPEWEDNAYFALAGLDAPKSVKDYYEYGRQKVIFHSYRYNDYKNKILIPYTHEVPETTYSLFRPYEPAENLKFESNGIENWACLHHVGNKANASECPPTQEILKLTEINSELWRRFRTLADHSNFSVPDHFIENVYNSNNLIELAQLNAVYTLDLLDKGHNEEAFKGWQNYMALYLKMSGSHTTAVDKAIFLVVLRIQKNLIETMLYNNPELAIDYGDEIKETLAINSAQHFRAGQIFADDWRVFEPIFLGTLGSSANQKRLLHSCFEENRKIADLPPEEIFKIDDRFCTDQYPEDLGQLMLKSFTDAGNAVSNIIYNLLIGGVIKGISLIHNINYSIADFKMAIVATELIRANVSSDNIQDYLNSMPEKYWNPITNKPFLWDDETLSLYYPNPKNPELEPLRVFQINLKL